MTYQREPPLLVGLLPEGASLDRIALVMRPNSGKKGSRGTKGSKKYAKMNAKRSGKPTRGRGGSKAGGRLGRRLSFEEGPKKTKLSGMRKGDLSGKDLRFTPVLFVKAVDDFELTLETKPEDEGEEKLEPVDPPIVLEDLETRDGTPSLEEDVVATLRASPEAERETKTQEEIVSPAPRPQSPHSDDALLEASDSDFDEIDAQLEAQFCGVELPSVDDPRSEHLSHGSETELRLSTPELNSAFDESVSRLAIDSSSSDSDEAPFEYDLYNASQVDESIFESLSDDEPPLNVLLHDDFDYSDLTTGHNEEENGDEDDHMDELDDDQIFALASMATRKVNEYDEFDESGYDKYDEFDEYFDQLLDRSTEVPPSTKQRASEGRRLKREARQLLHSMNFGKDPVLWQKYPEELGIREVLEEIRHFAAQREFQSLSFPPLDTNANWYVKQLAKEHGLRPSVEGRNSTKHVICFLTGRATPHGGKGVNKLLNRRKFFRRVDQGPIEGKHKVRAPGAKVRDGHVVGQHAAEITNENIGHRLMRQMGWSEGHGLGKERAGIVAPIPATVKLTKAGLGA